MGDNDELNRQPMVAIDLSHLPKSVQEAVGPEIARTIAAQLRPGKRPVIVGKLDPGRWGFVRPDLLKGDFGREFDALLKKGLAG